ncbi:acyltransferase domain-containing protein, partial [Streptomyces galbus]|uniref:acyltransferase domain-containing protein n=1 Tax=Streptomyces galbus TaxID=33898 RepID=UPI00381DC669
WPQTGRPRRAGVSSFGISGTNAHLILEQAEDATSGPEQEQTGSTGSTGPKAATGVLVPWTVSARSVPALRGQAQRLTTHLRKQARPSPLDVAFSLATRSAFEHRAVVYGRDLEDLLAGMEKVGTGETPVGGALGEGGPGGRLAVLFSGHGPAQWGAGRSLYQEFTPFADAFDQVCETLDPLLGHPLKALVLAGGGPAESALLNRADVAGPASFALGVALHRLAAAWGAPVDAVMGHGAGEVAAAHAAGSLSLTDAARLVVAQGRVERSAEEDASGARAALDELADVVADLSVKAPALTLVSAATGEAVTTERLATPGHWSGGSRDPGRRSAVSATTGARSFASVLEIRGTRVTTFVPGAGRETERASDGVPSSDADVFVLAMAELEARGHLFDRTAAFEASRAVAVELPTYAFQPRPYWIRDGVPVRAVAPGSA